ncbi:aminoglycoside phosphotransferase family protein [Bradyrhizobium sp. USDA 4452]
MLHMGAGLMLRRQLFECDQRGGQSFRDHPFVVSGNSLSRHHHTLRRSGCNIVAREGWGLSSTNMAKAARNRLARPYHDASQGTSVAAARGWLAIDPKHLVGERGFDYANIFTNPDLADLARPVATEPGRFARRLDIVVQAARLDRRRLLSWIVAWTGLSAALLLGDDDLLAEINLQIANLATAELDRMA